MKEALSLVCKLSSMAMIGSAVDEKQIKKSVVGWTR